MTLVSVFTRITTIKLVFLLLRATTEEIGGEAFQNVTASQNISKGFPEMYDSPNAISCKLENCKNKVKLEWYEYYIRPEDDNLIYITMRDEPFLLHQYALCQNSAEVCMDNMTANRKYAMICHFIILAQDEYFFDSNNSLHIIDMNETLPIPIYLELGNPIGAVNVCYPLSSTFKECEFKLSTRKALYTIFENKTLLDHYSGNYFDPENYTISNDYNINEYDIAYFCFTFHGLKPWERRPVTRNISIQIIHIISIICLIIVFSLHIAYPSINHHSKPLLCHIICTIATQILLVMRSADTGLMRSVYINGCYWTAGLLYFSTICGFTWVNILAFDVWWSFSKLNMKTGSGKCCNVQRFEMPIWCKMPFRPFTMYCIHGWGIPIMMLVAVIIYQVGNIPSKFSPVFSMRSSCWFKNMQTGALFMYGPLSFTVTGNLIFFALTVYNLYYISKGSNLVNKKVSKQLIVVSLKLFVLMSLTWILKEIDAILNPANERTELKWLIINIIVASQGIFVFIIYVCKSSTYNIIVNKRKEIPTKRVTKSSTCKTTSTDVPSQSDKSGNRDNSIIKSP